MDISSYQSYYQSRVDVVLDNMNVKYENLNTFYLSKFKARHLDYRLKTSELFFNIMQEEYAPN